MEDKKKKKSKQFVEKPQYPGGSKAINAFLKAHLQYPQDAMEQRIEGIVRVSYQVSDEGKVENAKVVQGLCPSCDAEALRLVQLLEYCPAHNRGIRLKSNCHINIHFQLAPTPAKSTLNITFTPTKTAAKPQKTSTHYGYSITIKNK